MTTHDAMAPDAILQMPAIRGKSKSTKLKQQKEARGFGEILDKTATTGRQSDAETRSNSLKPELRFQVISPRLTQTASITVEEAEAEAVAAATPLEKHIVSIEDVVEVEEQDEEEAPSTRQPQRSGVAMARLEQLFGTMLPGTVHRQLADQVETEVQSDIPIELKTQHAQHSRIQLDQREDTKSAEAAKAETGTDFGMQGAAPADTLRAPAAVRSDKKTADTAPPDMHKLESVVVTRVETVLLPAGATAGPVPIHAADAKATAPVISVAPQLPSGPEQSVVKTIELRLQPEELGDVKIAIQMRGDDLRVQVEASTREAHALLQRDKGALTQLLEKAGYDIAEGAVTLTLKPDMQPAATTSTGNDATAQQRGGNGTSEAFHQQASEHQSRQASRHPQRQESHGRAPEIQPGAAARQDGGRGIYI